MVLVNSIMNDDTPTLTIEIVLRTKGHLGTMAFVFTVRLNEAVERWMNFRSNGLRM